MIATSSLAVLALVGSSAAGPPAVGPDTACVVMDMNIEDRLSPLDSLTFEVDGHPVKVCYGRPSARGRTMIGGHDVPYGKLWRTGANEPTMIHTTVPITVAGIQLEKGSYSLYTRPGEQEWVVILNRSITQWGHIASYNYKVRKQEVGQARLPRERPEQHVELMTFRAELATNGGVVLVLEWEQSQIRIPIATATGTSSTF
ncbi:MAG: DUF2911 domain-containing protein [Gemmatimonadota bacterium]|nr:MAG: DUF2911 domain-containing protein [Gemmatimonadota bacterium]